MQSMKNVVKFMPAILTGGVVVGKGVVVVVEALTHSSQRNQDILSGLNVLVIWAISKHVGSAVHQPGGIEHYGITQKSGHVQAVSKSFTPEIPGHECGQDEAHQQDGGFVVPPLEHHQFLGFEV